MEVKKETGYPHFDRPWMKYYDEEILKRVDPKTNLTDYLKNITKENGSTIATEYYGKTRTYDEFWNRVDTSSKVLTDLGIKEDEKIINLVPCIPEAGEIWLGASQIGVVSDFIDPRPDTMDKSANAKKVLELFKYEKVDHVVTLDMCYPAMIQPIENELKDMGINRIITLSASDSMNIMGKINYLVDALQYNKLKNERNREQAIKELKWYQALLTKMEMMKKGNAAYEELSKKSPLEIVKYVDLANNTKYSKFTEIKDEEKLCYIGHTSGTSGSRPKPITLTNKNLISSLEQQIKSNIIFNEGDRALQVLPYFAPFGADNNYLLSIISKSTNIVVPEFEINEFGYLLKKYKPNVIIGTPAWIAALPNCKYLDDIDLSFITRIIYGGDSMTKEDEENVNRWLESHGSKTKVHKGHGMSEFAGCGSYARDDYNLYESIGIPMSDMIYTIVDPDVEDHLEPVKFKDGEEFLNGELVVSGDSVTSGILNGDVIVPHYMMDGKSYIRTRDEVTMNRDGVFFFKSRKDRSFTRFDGYKIKPYEIEKVIEDNDNVKYCRLVEYFDDKQRGLMPIAHIVPEKEYLTNEEQKALVEEIVKEQIIANPNMSSRQIPARFKIREKMPLSQNGKVDFKSLIKEGIDGSEILVNVEETNLNVGNIDIIMPEEEKVKSLVRK